MEYERIHFVEIPFQLLRCSCASLLHAQTYVAWGEFGEFVWNNNTRNKQPIQRKLGDMR